MIRVAGQAFDVPRAVRCFHRFDHETRANMMASRRLGYRQRQHEGEYFYIHEFVPGIAFPTRGQAESAALKTVSMGRAQ